MRMVIAAAVAALLVPATAAAQAPVGLWSLASDGHPRVGNSLPVSVDGLRACPPGGACVEIDDLALPYEPGETAAGTVFEADVFGVTQRSSAWTGRVGSTLEPTMRGSLATGATLEPVAGRWTGGWGDDVSRLALFVCRTENGDGCRYVAGPLRDDYAGMYAFAVDARRAGNDHVGLAPPDGSSYPLPARTATVAVSAANGPIAATSRDAPPIVPPRATAPGGGPTTTPESKPPRVTLRRRALRSGKRVTVGSITCAKRCRVRLRVGDGRRTIKRTLSVRGSTRLTIVNASKLRRKVRLRVTVIVDGKRLASGRVRG